MKWLSLTYRTGFFLLVAALVIFLFGELFASTFIEAPPNGGGGRGEPGFNWISSALYVVAGAGSVLLLASGLIEAGRTKRGGGRAEQ